MGRSLDRFRIAVKHGDDIYGDGTQQAALATGILSEVLKTGSQIAESEAAKKKSAQEEKSKREAEAAARDARKKADEARDDAELKTMAAAREANPAGPKHLEAAKAQQVARRLDNEARELEIKAGMSAPISPYRPEAAQAGMPMWQKVAIGGGVGLGVLGLIFGVRAMMRK